MIHSPYIQSQWPLFPQAHQGLRHKMPTHLDGEDLTGCEPLSRSLWSAQTGRMNQIFTQNSQRDSKTYLP